MFSSISTHTIFDRYCSSYLCSSYLSTLFRFFIFFFFQAEDGIRDLIVTGVQTCALPIYRVRRSAPAPVGALLPLIFLGERKKTKGAPAPIQPGRRSVGYDKRRCRRRAKRSEERRVGKECRSRWSPYH